LGKKSNNLIDLESAEAEFSQLFRGHSGYVVPGKEVPFVGHDDYLLFRPLYSRKTAILRTNLSPFSDICCFWCVMPPLT